MAWIACPKCTHTFRAGPYHVQVCPACGHRGPADLSKEPNPVTIDEGAPTFPPVEGVVGKPRRFMGYLFLTLVTLNVYSIYWFGKVFGELDRQHGRKSLRGLYAVHVLCWVLLYALAVAEVYLVLQDIRLKDSGVLAQAALGITLAVAAFVTWLVYVLLEMGRLRDYRRAHGLGAGVGRVTFFFLALLILPALAGIALSFVPAVQDEMGDNARFLRLTGVLLLPFLLGIGLLARSVQRLWFRIYAERGAMLPPWAQKVAGDDAGMPSRA